MGKSTTKTAKHPRVQKAVEETPDQFYKDLGDLVDRATQNAGDRSLVLMAAADWINDQMDSAGGPKGDDEALASIFNDG